MKILIILLVPLFVLIAGCSDDKEATIKGGTAYSSMLDSQIKTMEKAKAVEDVLQDASNKRLEDLDQ